MNTAIRAVVRTASYHQCKISGVYQGFHGLLNDHIVGLDARSVANIIQRGGTMLRSARCLPFYEKGPRAVAAENLKKREIDSLVVIGGDGSFRGAHCLYEEHGIDVIGLPGTIDNDIAGTDVTIGFNTAMNIATDAIDRLRDTAASHDRLFLVEVMGRHAGHIALNVGVAAGAEGILLPEVPFDYQGLIDGIQRSAKKGKLSSIIVVAEGAYPGGATALTERIRQESDLEVRTTILGHIQRGGSPSTRDRVLASRLGYHAVLAILQGKSDIMVGIDKRGTVFIPLKDTWETRKDIDLDLYNMAKVLAV